MKSSATHPGTALAWQNRRKTRGTPVLEATVLLNYGRLLFARRVTAGVAYEEARHLSRS